MSNNLNRLVFSAQDEILRAVSQEPARGKELEARVLHWINWRETQESDIIHETKPIHLLAYILAYKRLEAEGKIKITRPHGVPFPMTDHFTIFEKRAE